MAKLCSKCEKQLSFRNSFVWEGKPICKSCLQEIEQGAKQTKAEQIYEVSPLPQVSPTESLYLHIPVARLILLSIASCGIYEAYWIYKNWRFIKERQSLNIQPFWRGIFGIFFFYSLLKEISNDNEASAILKPSFSPGGLTMGWVIFVILANLIGRTPGIAASIIAFVMPSYLFLVPVQNYINSVTEKRSPSVSYYGWSSGHVVCLTIGIIVWAVTLFVLKA